MTDRPMALSRAECLQDGDQGQDGVAQGLGEGRVQGACRSAAEPGQQLGGGAPAGVAVLDAERGHALSPRPAAGPGVG